MRKPRCSEYQRAVPATSGTKKVGTAALIWMSARMAVGVSVIEGVSGVCLWRATWPCEVTCRLTDRAKLRAQYQRAQGGGAADKEASQRNNAIPPYL